MLLLQIALWIASVFLALAFFAAATNKLIREKPELEQTMPWSAEFSERQLKYISFAEIAGALGLILPEVTGIFPILTPIAALGLAVVQVFAFRVHRRRGETRAMSVNVVLFALAVFVAVGRFFVHA